MASRDVGNLRTRLSWEDDGAARSLSGFRNDLKGLSSEMRVAQSRGKDYTSSLKGMQSQQDILTRKFKTQKEQVRELGRRYEESRRIKGEDAKQTQNLAAQYNNAKARMHETEQELRQLTQAIEAQQNPWKKLSDSATAAGDKLQSIGRGMSSFGREYSMKVTAPIVAGATVAFKAAMDFESAFAGVRKTVDATEPEFAKLEQGIRDMAKELPASASSIAGVAEAAGQLGIAKGDILDFTRTMIDLGESTNMTSEEAATQLARFANITGMSMKDISRLGSTIVDLGNNSATTEGEIVSLGMRIAAAGTMAGMSEAEIMAISAAASSLGVEAEAGGTALSMAFTKITNAVDGGGKKLGAFAKASGMTAKDFAKAWKEEPTVAFEALLKGLNKSSEAGENMSGILDALGIKGIREVDVIKRLAGAHDLFSDSIEIGNNAWKENTALSNEAGQRYATTESQLKMLRNRVTDMAITVGQALIPAVMGALDAIGPWVDKIEEAANAFADMDEEQQRAIIKTVALVAAIGPASMALGGLFTTVGGGLKILGSFAGLLGKAGGGGLLGRIGLMGAAGGPVGLAVVGVGGLILAMEALNNETDRTVEETLKHIETRKAEIDQLDANIERFGVLQEKNKLTTDEMLRYLDIMTELKNARTEEGIKKLTDEQAKLLEKSGLTNEEMTEFLELNGKIVEEAPNAAKAISDQGNAYAAVLEEVQKLNDAERARLVDETAVRLSEEMDKQARLLKDQKAIQQEIKELEGERDAQLSVVTDWTDKVLQLERERRELQNQLNGATKEERDEIQQKIMQKDTEIQQSRTNLDLQDKRLTGMDKDIEKQNEKLGKIDKELALYDKLVGEYEALVLAEVGLNSERGKGLDALKKQQDEITKKRKKLEEENRTTLKGNEIYQERSRDLDTQKRKIDEAIRKLERMNVVGSESIDKDIKVTMKPSPEAINKLLGSTIFRTMKVNVSGPAANVPQRLAYAKGTNYHPGGEFIAGEEGPELARIGNKWSLLDYGLYTAPPGMEVLTHRETMKALNNLNRRPQYADGVGLNNTAAQILDQLSTTTNSDQRIELHLTVVSELDGKEIGRSPVVRKEISVGLREDGRMGARRHGVIMT